MSAVPGIPGQFDLPGSRLWVVTDRATGTIEVLMGPASGGARLVGSVVSLAAARAVVRLMSVGDQPTECQRRAMSDAQSAQ